MDSGHAGGQVRRLDLYYLHNGVSGTAVSPYHFIVLATAPQASSECPLNTDSIAIVCLLQDLQPNTLQASSRSTVVQAWADSSEILAGHRTVVDVEDETDHIRLDTKGGVEEWR